MPRNSVVFAALVAGVFSVSAADAAVLVTVDKSIQQMTVEVDGRPLYQWPVSTGKAGNYETPGGKYKAFRMERDHFSKQWDDAPMPFSIFFTQKGHAIHGSNETKRLGTPASHGCVRLLPANAEKLFALVEKEGVLNTKKGELEKIIASTEKEEKHFSKLSSEAREKVEDRLLHSYDRIRKNYRNGLAVVEVERDACGGCFNAIPPQRQSEIRQRKKIIVCENCGRILVDHDLFNIVEVK